MWLQNYEHDKYATKKVLKQNKHSENLLRPLFGYFVSLNILQICSYLSLYSCDCSSCWWPCEKYESDLDSSTYVSTSKVEVKTYFYTTDQILY